MDKRCCRWLLKNRLNVDQATLPFVVKQDKTHKMLGNKQVWISQPAKVWPGQEPNQLCIRTEGGQIVKPAIIFKRKGTV